MAVVEAKYVWIGHDGKLHYISKDTFDKVVKVAEKTIDTGIKVAVFTGMSAVMGGPVYAAAATGNKVMEGLGPVIKIITDFAQPVCYGYMVKSGLKMASGKEEEAKKIFSNSAISYVGIKFIPQVFKFLDTLQLFS